MKKYIMMVFVLSAMACTGCSFMEVNSDNISDELCGTIEDTKFALMSEENRQTVSTDTQTTAQTESTAQTHTTVSAIATEITLTSSESEMEQQDSSDETTTTAIPISETVQESDSTETMQEPIPEELNLQVSNISVGTLKATWNVTDGKTYQVSCNSTDPEYAYAGNIFIDYRENGLCYINGLRENSEYLITVIADNDDLQRTEALARTETVNVIEEFPYEDGWTNCFAYERASGLTAMPSSGAIYGSVADPITGTGIRRNEYGDYCCAMGLFYGTCWDRFLITLENGVQFTTKICDSKGWADDADGDGIADGRFHWFGSGKCIVEFIHDGYNPPSGVAYAGNYGYWNWNGLDLGANIQSVKKIDYPDNPIEY